MKKLITIILFISLVAPFIIGLRTYNVQLKRIKKSVKKSITEQIDKTLLVRLSFNKSEITKLDWKHTKEFEHNTEMYDVVFKEIKSDSIIYWCWLDNEETILEKSLNKLIAKSIGKNEENNQTKDFIKQLIKKVYIQEYISLITNSSFVENNYKIISESAITSIPLDISLPPPRLSI